MRMQEAEIYYYARQLLEAHGAKAVAEAAQKACALGRGDRRLLQRAMRSGPARALCSMQVKAFCDFISASLPLATISSLP